MSRKIEIVMVRMYRVIDNETGTVVAETLDYSEAEEKAGFSEAPAKQYSLSDCYFYGTNVRGDCGGRVEEVLGLVICENCRNRPNK